jgi:hypothetical protein
MPHHPPFILFLFTLTTSTHSQSLTTLDFGRPFFSRIQPSTARQLLYSTFKPLYPPSSKSSQIPLKSIKMRFAVIAALYAGAVAAWSTTYVTDVITITSCAATVTNCPARSTVTSTTSYPVALTGTVTAYSTGTITCEYSIYEGMRGK